MADLDRYWQQVHVRNYTAGITKELYEFIRQNGGIDAFRILLLDTTASGLTERDYVLLLTQEGHRLLNANAGNSKVAAKPARSKSLFTRLNREAHERIEAAERQKRLHNRAQQLTKSELTRQRLTGAYPTLEQLQSATWTPCPAELLSVQLARSATSAQYAKFGEYTVLFAERAKDNRRAMIVRRLDGAELNLDKGWSGATMAKFLENLDEHLTSDRVIWCARRDSW